jgi:hypothetical protein
MVGQLGNDRQNDVKNLGNKGKDTDGGCFNNLVVFGIDWHIE